MNIKSFKPKSAFTKFIRKFVSNPTPKKRKYQNFEINDKLGIILSMDDKPGTLFEILKVFKENNVNLSYICSKPSKFFSSPEEKKVDVVLDIEKRGNEGDILKTFEQINQLAELKLTASEKVPWFPKSMYDLNMIGEDLKLGGEQLSSDHPGFNDPVYKKRRDEIEKISSSFEFGGQMPDIEYTEEETKVWSFMWDSLIPLHKKHACREFLQSFDWFVEDGIFKRDKIPQVSEINAYLAKKTNFFYRPVGGLLSEREFLNCLAFRVFPSTQYIRHGSKPLYTPEPDIIHEFLGHAPLFANQEFADFSQEIGLASLGVEDDEIKNLATIYWYTIEFGVLLQDNKIKIYGGGILSSPSEIENSVREDTVRKDFNLDVMAKTDVDITNIQTLYFLAQSFKKMKKDVLAYSEKIKRNFSISYNKENNSIDVDRRISTYH